MYVKDQVIEWSNGLQSTVVETYSTGHFVISYVGGAGLVYGLCWYDMSITDEEVWCFHDECEPWRRTLEEVHKEMRDSCIMAQKD